ANWNSTDARGAVEIRFRAWDGTDGNVGGTTDIDVSIHGDATAYSAQELTAQLWVNAINDAPTLDAHLDPPPALDAIDEDVLAEDNPGTTVTSLLAQSGAADVELDPFLGIALTGVDSTNGVWEYWVDESQGWLPVPANLAETTALLLPYFA